jgi:hypothetical protein
MSGLRGRLKRLEKDAEGEKTVIECPTCGEEFVTHGDVAAEFICHEWVRESGGETYRETPEDVLRLFDHKHDPGAFVEKSSGLPFLSREVSGINLGGSFVGMEDPGE